MSLFISEKTNELIKKIVSDKSQVKLTIGTIHNGEMSCRLFDGTGEMPYVSYLYEMGSIGKVFTTSLFAKYLHNEQMQLDDSIAKYIPELNDGRYYPTLERLATHTAGYPTRYPKDSWADLFEYIWQSIRKRPISLTMNRQLMIDLLRECKLQDKDYAWKYANFGIAVLGQSISQVAEKPFFELMNAFMSQDLALQNTSMCGNTNGLLIGYDAKYREVKNWYVDENEYLIPAGAGMLSTAEDLLQFAKMNITETPKYLSLCHKIYAKRLTGKGEYGINMGLGWWQQSHGQYNMHLHGGDTDGFSSGLMFVKETATAVVIIVNKLCDNERWAILGSVLKDLGV